ncbi:MAG: Rhodanese-related sulfurtransferase [Roseibaca calidilacus]|uniref:Rhodanese-related sulfurtransferase n=1 Tax=Roseibaca calidilacus TaxID=1666912 RepID=A0A0P7WLW4_9RHOB|nr:rhodanese-like domain-containing protein [Roseibaca calidilacus]KPP91827.1 MAG: Rhodanese-related sulfurtransferase [Roseibaca calidilacus]CUX82450.1 Rhodanese-related sulfurtransferase [Roseibaca calidilacus]
MRFLTLALVALLGLGSPALAQQHYVAQPSASELQAADVLLVDIRRPEEWKQTGVLPNAHLLTYEQFDTPEAFLEALAPQLDGRPVALICRTGNRTNIAARALAERLDQPVIDIQGGIMRLMRDGYSPDTPTRAQGCETC